MGAAQRIAAEPQDLLRGGLAGAAGNGQDFGAAAQARAARARSSRPRWVSATVSRGPLAFSSGRLTSRRAGLGVKGGAHEIMAVAGALQRDKQIAFLQGAGVDGNAAHGKGLAGAAQGGGFGFGGIPQRHAARPPNANAAFTASSRSENGSTSFPTYWPVSWPLPASTSTSPAWSAAMAARMASARSPISRAPGCGSENFLADGGGIFAAGIVVGDDHIVGQRGRDLAHQRALALVAVAAAAEHHMQLCLWYADAAPSGLSPANPACGHNRHRSARR